MFSSLEGLVRPVEHKGGTSRHLYQIMAKDRDSLMVAMNAASVYPGVHYKDNRAYRMYSGCKSDAGCHFARSCSDGLVSLPLHLRLTHSDVVRVVESIASFYRRMP
jgi:dTDP-4-amino-4,6-dideoxygalactose transaminase